MTRDEFTAFCNDLFVEWHEGMKTEAEECAKELDAFDPAFADKFRVVIGAVDACYQHIKTRKES